jgi:HlyD family secretion protein
MRKKIVFIAVTVLMILIVLAVFYARKSKGPSAIRTTGVVEGIEVNISSMIAGRILKECCREGDTVQQGQVLLELESEELKASMAQALTGIEKSKAELKVCASAIETARANAASVAADIEDAAAEVEKARVKMEEAKRELDRYSELYKKRIFARANYDVALTAYKTAVADHRSSAAKLAATKSKKSAADAQLQTAENQLTADQAGLKESEANLSVSQAKLKQTVITSPISGTIVFKALEAGETVSPGVTILTIVDLNHLYVRVDVEETRIGRIVLNQAATIQTEGAPARIFSGKVSKIGRYAEFATQKDVTRGRQDIKTFKIKIDVEDSGGFLKPGMTVEVEMTQQDEK